MTDSSKSGERAASRIGRSTLIYGLSAVISQAALLIGAPIFTRALGPAGFGTLELLVVGLHLGSIILVAGLDTAAIRRFVSANGSPEQVSIVSSGLAFVTMSSVAALVLMLSLRNRIAGWLGMDDGVVIPAAALALVFLVTSRYGRELLHAQQRPTAYLVNATTMSILQVGLGVALVVAWDLGVGGIMLAYAAGGAVAVAMSLSLSRHLIRLTVSKSDVGSLLSFGIPLLWAGLAGWSLMFADRVLLQALAGSAEVGIYALAYRIAAVLTLLIYAFNRAWTPAILELANRSVHRAAEVQARTLTMYTALVAWATVAVSSLARPLVYLLGGGDFSDAVMLVPIIAMAVALLGPIPIVQSPMLIHDRTRALAWSSLLAAGVNIVLNLVLIPSLGALGAAWATAVGFAVQLASYWMLANRIHPVRYDVGALLRISISAVVLVGVSTLFPDSGIFAWLAPAVFIAAFPLALVGLRVLTVNELRPSRLRELPAGGTRQ